MAHRSPARLLAPLALVAAAVAIIVVVQASTDSGGDRGGTAKPAAATHSKSRTAGTSHTRTTATSTAAKRNAQTYTVKPGDILSTVSEKTGVPVARIQELNPGLDAQALQVGQKIKLTPDAGTP